MRRRRKKVKRRRRGGSRSITQRKGRGKNVEAAEWSGGSLNTNRLMHRLTSLEKRGERATKCGGEGGRKVENWGESMKRVC